MPQREENNCSCIKSFQQRTDVLPKVKLLWFLKVILKFTKHIFFGAHERPCAQSKGGKYFYSWKIRHNKVLTAFISLRIRDCLKDQCKVLTNAACVCQHYRKVRFPKVSVKYFECNKLSSTKNIHLILLNPDRTPGLFCPVLSIFFSIGIL